MTPLVFALCIDALCAFGLYAASFMQRKANRYARGLELEPSVVQQPRARLFGGVANSTIGLVYYALLVPAAWWLHVPWVYAAALAAALLAAAVSVFLAYSLLFITRLPCPYCWTGHVVNWSLATLLAGYPMHSRGF